MRNFDRIDSEFLVKIQELCNKKSLDKFFVVYTHLGDYAAIWFVLGFTLLFIDSTVNIGFFMLLTILLNYIITELIIKNLIKRTRPYKVNKDVRLIVREEKTNSFPSGHSATAIACATIVLNMYGGILGIFILLFSLGMAFSRLYAGVHYPSDVLVGGVVGFVIASIICLLTGF